MLFAPAARSPLREPAFPHTHAVAAHLAEMSVESVETLHKILGVSAMYGKVGTWVPRQNCYSPHVLHSEP